MCKRKQDLFYFFNVTIWWQMFWVRQSICINGNEMVPNCTPHKRQILNFIRVIGTFSFTKPYTLPWLNIGERESKSFFCWKTIPPFTDESHIMLCLVILLTVWLDDQTLTKRLSTWWQVDISHILTIPCLHKSRQMRKR